MTRPALLNQGERTDEGRGSLPSPSLFHLPAPPPIFRLISFEKINVAHSIVQFSAKVARSIMQLSYNQKAEYHCEVLSPYLYFTYSYGKG